MNYREIQKLRTRSTIMIVKELYEKVNANDLISDLFVATNNKESQSLIKKYEQIIIKGKLEETYLRDNLNVFYRDMSKYIKKNNLFKIFVEFAYFIYSTLSKKNYKSRDSLDIYQNILLQQYEYLSPENKIIYGVNTNGKIMIKNQTFPFSDYPVYEIEKNRITDKNKIIKTFKKYGYTDKMVENMEIVVRDDGLAENMILSMINFINENTEDMVPKKYMKASKSTDICNIFIGENIGDIKNRLKRRKYMLPTNGIIGKYENVNDVKFVKFKEIFQEDKIFLLYQMKNDLDEGIYGVYDLKNDFFYSLYRDTSIESKSHKNIEKFILKNYSMLTTEETEENESSDLIQVNNIEKEKNEYIFPIVEFLYEDEKESDKSEKKYRNFDKKKYKEDKVSINPYIRKLPIGATASEEAIEKARNFGYELGEGETFVSPFTRTTFRNKD